MLRLAFILLLSFSACIAHAQQQKEEIRKSIFFGGGSYEIDTLQQVELYQWLDSVPDLLDKYNITLISHTDPIGGKAFNDWLSKMRSEAVQYLLLQKEIPDHKISIKDWGFENAVYRNDSYRGMRMNRRVDVILYPVVF